ncbi:MAG: SGNH/GDSL hydrolase family protein [Lachnospiraceae bacterium]|nr:SGNH/GDSL hydrolase family protein [Lachnospiraceae bacterium]
MELKGLKINFLGDSITEGCNASKPEYTYWRRFEKDGSIVRGYGIGGTRIAKQHTPSNEVWDRFFRSRVDEMDPDADVIVIFGGTNDYGHGDAPLGCMEDRTDETFYGALHLLYQSILSKYPKAEIVIMTPIHYSDEYALFNGLGVPVRGCLEDYVDIIMDVAAYYALPVLDLYRLSGIQPAEEMLRKRYAPDGLHPNDEGHERIYKLLKNFIKYNI